MRVLNRSVSALLLALFLGACASKTPPVDAVSNAKMALVKAENLEKKHFVEKELKATKQKYEVMQKMMAKEHFDEALLLAREIQADTRLLQAKSLRLAREEEVKKMQGEINTINKDFTSIAE